MQNGDERGRNDWWWDHVGEYNNRSNNKHGQIKLVEQINVIFEYLQ